KTPSSQAIADSIMEGFRQSLKKNVHYNKPPAMTIWHFYIRVMARRLSALIPTAHPTGQQPCSI
ncbi:MAG: hypothetical protein ABI656_11060, partial [bacterium]